MQIPYILGGALLFLAPQLAADVIVSGHGLFGPDVPVTNWAAPDSAFDFSFLVSSVPLDSDDDSFVADFSLFDYALDSFPIAIAPVRVRMFDDALGGLFDVTFVDNGGVPRDGFSFAGPTVFSGPGNAPEFAPGIYIGVSGSVAYVGALAYGLSDVSITLSEVPNSAVGEPSARWLLALTLAAGYLWNCLRRQGGAVIARRPEAA